MFLSLGYLDDLSVVGGVFGLQVGVDRLGDLTGLEIRFSQL